MIRSNLSSLQRAGVTMLKPLIAIAFAAAVGHGARAQTPIPPSPSDFAQAAAQSDQYEIAAAQDALAQSQNPQVRAFARTVIDDHTKSREMLNGAAVATGLRPPPKAMSRDQAALLGALQSLSGPDFDRIYAKQQVLAHQQALAVEQSFAMGGADPSLRRFARTDAPMIQRHLELAQHLRAVLGES